MSLTDEQIGLITTDPQWSHVETPLLADFARAIERESALKWTDALPTKQDWYWIKTHQHPKVPIIVFVMRLQRGLVVDDGGFQERFIPLTKFAKLVDQWAGPIPQPPDVVKK